MKLLIQLFSDRSSVCHPVKRYVQWAPALVWDEQLIQGVPERLDKVCLSASPFAIEHDGVSLRVWKSAIGEDSVGDVLISSEFKKLNYVRFCLRHFQAISGKGGYDFFSKTTAATVGAPSRTIQHFFQQTVKAASDSKAARIRSLLLSNPVAAGPVPANLLVNEMSNIPPQLPGTGWTAIHPSCLHLFKQLQEDGRVAWHRGSEGTCPPPAPAPAATRRTGPCAPEVRSTSRLRAVPSAP